MRLGLLGGTYDPIHLGHLLLAEQARDALGLDQVLLIPAGRPPHKPDRPVTAYSDRFEMVRLAVDGMDGLAASDLERATDHPSYTAETLRRLSGRLAGGDELWLLMGSDSLIELPTWRDPEAILHLARLAVYPRPGTDAAAFPVPAPGPIHWLDGPRLRLSSSEIRESVRAGRSIRFLVPEPVRDFIRQKKLYLSDMEPGGRSPDAGGFGASPEAQHG